MKFSILTITYQAEAYLADTLASVQKQGYRDFEHLVWDGGSTDKTLEIIKSFPHVRLFIGKDQGISDAMNKIAQKAQGEWLWYVHADDLLAPEALQEVAEELKKSPQTDWVYGRAHIIDAHGRCLRTTPLEIFTQKRLKKYNFLTHPSTVMSKKLFESVGGFDCSLKYCMDYDLWLRAACVCSPRVLSGVLSSFREHMGSTSCAAQMKVAHEAYAVRNRYIKGWLERWRSYRTWKKRHKHICRHNTI